MDTPTRPIVDILEWDLALSAKIVPEANRIPCAREPEVQERDHLKA